MSTSIDRQLDDLRADDVVRRLVRDVAGSHSLATDRRSNYLSLRPLPVGAIAVYVHAGRVSIAMDPPVAQLEQPAVVGATAQRATAATTYLIVGSEDIRTSYDVVLRWASEALAWRSTGPQVTLGVGRARRPERVLETCPNGWMEITPAGVCGCMCE